MRWGERPVSSGCRRRSWAPLPITYQTCQPRQPRRTYQSRQPLPEAPDAPDAPEQPAAPEPRDPVRATPQREALEAEDGLQFETELDAFLDDLLDDPGQRPITLADVGGLEDVKHRLQMSFLEPMRNPQLRKMFGKSLRGGLLLYGPPGCGKTFLARAVAGELAAHFINVGLHDVLDMWIGNSEKNIHGLFERARRRAPCVLFLDEIDALGRKRSQLSSGAGRNVVVQFLDELDSTRDDNEGVFVLGATNQPWDIDAALRRPGRLDRMLLVLPPDEAARLAILELHLRDRPVGHVDLPQLARHTQGYSGADLRLLCETATEAALWDSIRAGSPRQISVADFQKALSEIRPSTRPWFETAYNYALFANEGGSYDDLLAYIRKHRLA